MSLNVKQVPERIGYYLAGFADGEGSFNISFRPREDYYVPWKVSVCFNVSQRDKVVLTLFRRYLNCGTMRQRSDGVWYYEVNKFSDLVDYVIPFFKRFGFLSAKKKRDFSKFKQIAVSMRNNDHLTEEGIRKILEIRRDMNDGGVKRRKYSEKEIVACFDKKESSETICHTLSDSEDIVRSV